MSINLEKIAMEKFTSRMGRNIDKNTLVGVHWNAHKKVWSIVEFKSRHSVKKVLGYASQVTLRDVTTHIDNAKRKKVLETGKKDRHAFMVGYIEDLVYTDLDNVAYYNPKRVNNFVDGKKYFLEMEKEYLERMSKVSLDFDFDNNHPVVMYA